MTLAFVEDGVITRYPCGAVDVRRAFPNVSFRLPLEGQDLSEFGVVTVIATEQPVYDQENNKLEEGTPEYISNDWRQVWNVVPFTAEELQERETMKAASVRSKRDGLLSACDWTVLTDSPLTTAKKTEWKTYRQALRDITAAEGFPNTMTWPTEPS